jgi:hypothetical protein
MMRSLLNAIKKPSRAIKQPIDVLFDPLTRGKMSGDPLDSPAAAPQRGRAEVLGCFDAPPHELDPR